VMQRDGDAAGLFLRRVVDLIDILLLLGPALHVQDVSDGRGQGGLAVVDVANGADVQMRLGPIEFFFIRHFIFIKFLTVYFLALQPLEPKQRLPQGGQLLMILTQSSVLSSKVRIVEKSIGVIELLA